MIGVGDGKEGEFDKGSDGIEVDDKIEHAAAEMDDDGEGGEAELNEEAKQRGILMT